MRYGIQRENPAPLEHIEGFVHLKVAVDRNAGADHNLLSSHGQMVAARGRAHLDEDVATVSKMKEMFTFSRPEHVVMLHSCLGLYDALRKRFSHAEYTQQEEKESAILPN